MSNVVKLPKKKKLEIDNWKAEIEKQGDKLADRIHDAIRLADEEATDEGIPEELTDCSIVGVLVSIAVLITHTRTVLPPYKLLDLVIYEIERQDEIERKDG